MHLLLMGQIGVPVRFSASLKLRVCSNVKCRARPKWRTDAASQLAGAPTLASGTSCTRKPQAFDLTLKSGRSSTVDVWTSSDQLGWHQVTRSCHMQGFPWVIHMTPADEHL